jgi:creatinine amidohydrolase
MQDLTPAEDGQPRGHQDGLGGLDNPLIWYANFPTHYSGDARASSAEKGEFLVGARVRRLARQIKAIKDDAVSLDLLREFYDRSRNPE